MAATTRTTNSTAIACRFESAAGQRVDDDNDYIAVSGKCATRKSIGVADAGTPSSLPIYCALHANFTVHRLSEAMETPLPKHGGRGPTNQTLYLRELLRSAMP